MQNLIQRWKAESPLIFKWLTNLFVIVGSIAGAIIALKAGFPGRFDWFTTAIEKVLDYMLILGAVGAVLSKLTAKNIPKTTNNE